MQEDDGLGILRTLLAVNLTRLKKATAVCSLSKLELSHPRTRMQWKERNGFEKLCMKRAPFMQGLLWIKKSRATKNSFVIYSQIFMILSFTGEVQTD